LKITKTHIIIVDKMDSNSYPNRRKPKGERNLIKCRIYGTILLLLCLSTFIAGIVLATTDAADAKISYTYEGYLIHSECYNVTDANVMIAWNIDNDLNLASYVGHIDGCYYPSLADSTDDCCDNVIGSAVVFNTTTDGDISDLELLRVSSYGGRITGAIVLLFVAVVSGIAFGYIIKSRRATFLDVPLDALSEASGEQQV
jgi:hypothetical protein